MENKIDEILKAPYSRVLIPDENGTFAAELLEFPGCFAQGKNPNEAFKNLEEAAKAWIESSLERGLDIPQPSMNIGYSGKIALRIPRSLHKKSVQFAERDGISLNQFLISAIATRIGAEEYHSHLCKKFAQGLTYTFTTNNYLQQGAQLNLNVLLYGQGQTYLAYGQTFLGEAYNKEVIENGRGTQLRIQP